MAEPPTPTKPNPTIVKEGRRAKRKRLKTEAQRERILLERADAAMLVVTTLFDVDERKKKVHAKKKFISFDDIETAVRRAIAGKID